MTYKKKGTRRKKLVHVSARMAARAPGLAAYFRRKNRARVRARRR